MFSTDQFRVFPEAPQDRVLSRPRRLLQEGRAAEAEAAYQTVVVSHPDVRQAWVEYFALLRREARHQEALALAERAAGQFGEEALPAALRGAALVELGRYREGLEALDDAAGRDPNMAMVWHEAGYAAWRLGELTRALMALDRAFALEPHSGTLHLRGKVLRKAGRYLAAEVAFEAAAQAAEFAIQREAAEYEIRVTRRFAAFPGTKPDTLPPQRLWFAETGSVPLAGITGGIIDEAQLAGAVVTLARDLGWRFTTLVALDAWEGWPELARALGISFALALPDDPHAIPLVAARQPATLSNWAADSQVPARTGRGLSLGLWVPAGVTPPDVTGVLDNLTPRGPDSAFAVEAALHPEGRLRNRILS